MKGRVGVLIPVYNCQSELAETLTSLIEIESAQFDIYIVDDGSFPKIRKPNVHFSGACKLIRLEKNRGIENALNAGLQQMIHDNIDYVARLDAGDLVIRERFERQVACFEVNPKLAVVGTYARCVSKDGDLLLEGKKPLTDESIKKYLRINSPFWHPSVMFDLIKIVSVGAYATDYKYCEDFELWWRLKNAGYEFSNLDYASIDYIVSPASISNSKRKQQVANRLKVLWNNVSLLCISSYWGILRSSILFFFSSNTLWRFKSILGYRK